MNGKYTGGDKRLRQTERDTLDSIKNKIIKEVIEDLQKLGLSPEQADVQRIANETADSCFRAWNLKISDNQDSSKFSIYHACMSRLLKQNPNLDYYQAGRDASWLDVLKLALAADRDSKVKEPPFHRDASQTKTFIRGIEARTTAIEASIPTDDRLAQQAFQMGQKFTWEQPSSTSFHNDQFKAQAQIQNLAKIVDKYPMTSDSDLNRSFERLLNNELELLKPSQSSAVAPQVRPDPKNGKRVSQAKNQAKNQG